MRRRLCTVGAVLAFGVAAPGSAFAAETVVSLTFDDGIASELAAGPMLADHGMLGTFYVNTGTLGQFDRMTWSQLATLNADGHEIAGHTLDHVDITQAEPEEARRQVCDDRANLLGRGYAATSFAYPWGLWDGDAQAVVRECGYSSGRAAWGLRRIVDNPYPSRPWASPIPPPDPYAILVPCCIDSTVTLADFQDYIMGAENAGGGWVILLFHAICDGCAGNAVSPSLLDALLDWLEPRAATGTVVKTVTQVISGDSVTPTSSAGCNDGACSDDWYRAPVSVSLSAADAGTGVSAIRYILDGSEPTVESPLYAGSFTLSASTTVSFRAWDNAGNVEPAKSRTILIDGTLPSSEIACNGASCSSAWHAAPVTVTLAASDGDSGVAAIRYTLDGSEPTASSAVYGGPFTVSATATVSFRAWDNAGNVEATQMQHIAIDTEAPTVEITSPADGATVNGNVKIYATATDILSGVAGVSFYANGVLIGTKESSPYFVNWQTRKLKGTYTLTAVAVDAAGNSQTSEPVTVTVR